jgi:metal-sulfur cluster biosynthetic enzyme
MTPTVDECPVAETLNFQIKPVIWTSATPALPSAQIALRRNDLKVIR